MTKDVRQMDKTVVDEVLTRQIAGILVGGASITDCAKKLNISPAAVRRIIETDKYKAIVAEAGEEELAPALAKAKAQLARLTTKAVKAIEEVLDTGAGRDKLQAASIVLKAVGLHENEEKQNDGNITIIMPGGTQNTQEVIEVENVQPE